MHRLDANELSAIKGLTGSGASLKSIARMLGLGKTTVYYHFRKIRGKTYHAPTIRFPSEEMRGEVFGLFAGDGCITFAPRGYAYVVRVYCGIDHEYAEHVYNVFLECFGKRFRIGGPPRNIRVQTESKVLYHFFLTSLKFDRHDKAGTIHLKSMKLSHAFMRGFLRGFIDTDGHVNPLKRQIIFYTTSRKLAKQASAMADKLRIKHSIYVRKNPPYKDCYHIRILSCSINKFLETIKPFKWVHNGLVDQR